MKHPVLSVAKSTPILLIQSGHLVQLVQISYFDLLYAKTSRLLILPAQEWHLQVADRGNSSGPCGLKFHNCFQPCP